jgi:hypothetical protein
MRRFTTKPLTDIDLRECYVRLWMNWGKELILILRPLEFEHSISTTGSFPKGSICQILCWEPLDVIFLNQNQPEISPKIPLDRVSSKKKVVL